MPYTIPFAQLNKSDIPAASGKGANLGEMTAAGFPVLSGFVLTTGPILLEQFLNESRTS
jgi:phosphoenolpyruvate synthase/pyruvate phosphate dikinase